MNKKRFCVLQITPEKPTPEHVEMFRNGKDSDFYFVTHDAPHKEALKFCPHTTWTDTRNVLVELVPKKYEYYAFIDYDYILRPVNNNKLIRYFMICNHMHSTNIIFGMSPITV